MVLSALFIIFADVMRIDIITVLPEMLEGFFNESILARAQKKGLAEIHLHNLRDYTLDKWKRVDDYPYGGSAGMVMQCEPIDRCIAALKAEREYDDVIYVSPDGETFNQKIANEMSMQGNLIILCGHYKGIDQRVRDHLITREISEMMEKETDIDILIDGNTFTLLWEHGLYRYTGKLYPQGNIGVDIKYRAKRHYDITSLGEILIDFTGKKESERQTLSYTQNPGGAPANVVVAAQRLGAQTAFIGKVGEDFLGDFLKETLDKSGVSTEGLISDADYFTTLAFVKLADNGERNFAFARKPGADIGLKAEEIRKDIICQSRILHVGSLSLTDEISRNAEFIALKAAKNNGTIISYDPNYRASLWDSQEEACKWMRSILEYADIVKVSEEEIELLTGYTDVRKAAESITEYGAKIVLITLGEKGSFVYLQDQQEAYVSGYSSKVVDTTGAGDSFMGGFLYKICESGKRIEEYSLQEMIECVRFGNAMASLCVEREGAIPAMPVMEEVIKRINS